MKIDKKRYNTKAPSSWFLWEMHKVGSLTPSGYELLEERMKLLIESLGMQFDTDMAEIEMELKEVTDD